MLYSNIFISMCAAALTVETYLLVEYEINWLYITFAFCATLLIYNFPVFVGGEFDSGYSERHHWITSHKKIFILLSIPAFLICAFIALSFPLNFLISFIPITLIALAYFFPQTHLRSVTGLKSIIVAIVWTGVTAIYPILLISQVDFAQAFTLQNIALMAQNFFFMLPLCIIFNVKDIGWDRNAQVKTFPVVYGINVTKIICIASLAIFILIVMTVPVFDKTRMALIFSALLSGLLILYVSENKSDYYYSLWIDGMILFQAMLIFKIEIAG